jgi:hypothetical protein
MFKRMREGWTCALAGAVSLVGFAVAAGLRFVPGPGSAAALLLGWFFGFLALASAPVPGSLKDRLFFVGIGNVAMAAVIGIAISFLEMENDSLVRMMSQIAAMASGGAGGSLIAQFLIEHWRDDLARHDG